MRENRQMYHHEYRIILPDETIRWIAGFGHNYYDESGTPIRVVGLHDITERKRGRSPSSLCQPARASPRALNVAILASRSPREIAEAALGHLARHVPYGTAGVAVYDFDRDEVEIIATHGLLRDWHPPGVPSARS